MTGPETLTDAVDAPLGRPLDQLTTTEALDVADQLRAMLAALDASTPGETRYADDPAAVAELIETGAGIA